MSPRAEKFHLPGISPPNQTSFLCDLPAYRLPAGRQGRQVCLGGEKSISDKSGAV